MEIKVRDEKFADTGEDIQVFELTGKYCMAAGFIHNNTLCIHHIHGKNQVKEMMKTLCEKFKIRKFRFLMVVNPKLKEIIKGKVVMIPPDAPGNSFGEWVEEIHGEWKIEEEGNKLLEPVTVDMIARMKANHQPYHHLLEGFRKNCQKMKKQELSELLRKDRMIKKTMGVCVCSGCPNKAVKYNKCRYHVELNEQYKRNEKEKHQETKQIWLFMDKCEEETVSLLLSSDWYER